MSGDSESQSSLVSPEMENWHKLVPDKPELVCHLQVEGDVSLLRPGWAEL